jgi:hypothetical protein
MIELALLPAHERLAELHMISKKRKLRKSEQTELDQCMELNAKVMIEIGYIKNESQMSHKIDDVEWQHDICARIEAVSKKFIRGGIYSG